MSTLERQVRPPTSNADTREATVSVRRSPEPRVTLRDQSDTIWIAQVFDVTGSRCGLVEILLLMHSVLASLRMPAMIGSQSTAELNRLSRWDS